MKKKYFLLIITMIALVGKAQVTINTDGSSPAAGSILHVKGSGGHNFFIDDSNGKVGIGTITPSETLEVDGNAKVTGNINVGTKVNRAAQGTADLIPIAYGIVKYDGTILNAGTGNWTISHTSTGIYEISINNENYDSDNYMTQISVRYLLTGLRIPFFGNNGNNLEVRIKDGSSHLKDNSFHFIVYKP